MQVFRTRAHVCVRAWDCARECLCHVHPCRQRRLRPRVVPSQACWAALASQACRFPSRRGVGCTITVARLLLRSLRKLGLLALGRRNQRIAPPPLAIELVKRIRRPACPDFRSVGLVLRPAQAECTVLIVWAYAGRTMRALCQGGWGDPSLHHSRWACARAAAQSRASASFAPPVDRSHHYLASIFRSCCCEGGAGGERGRFRKQATHGWAMPSPIGSVEEGCKGWVGAPVLPLGLPGRSERRGAKPTVQVTSRHKFFYDSPCVWVVV